MRRPITTLLLLSLLVGAAWWTWASFAEEPPVAGPLPDVAPAPQPQDPAPAPPSPGPTLAADAPRVRVDATVRARLTPPPAPIGLRVTRGGVPTTEVVTVIAGAGSLLLQQDRPEGRALVAIDAADGGRLHRIVALGADAPAAIELGLPVTLRGHVVDDAGAPVVDARVDAGERSRVAPRTVATDADGAFAITVAAGAGIPLVVQATGRAAAHLVCDANGDVDGLRVVLAPECRLEVQLQAVAQDLGQATLFVLPDEAPTTELLRVPFFLQAITGGTPADDAGRCVFHGLPADGVVRVLVHHPLVPIAAPRPVVLSRGVATATVPLAAVPVGALPSVHGRVVDARGVPVAGAIAVAGTQPRVARGAGHRLLPALTDAVGAAVAFTDADGRFRVGVPAGDASLAIRAEGLAGIDVSLAGPARVDLGELRLADWRGAPFELRVPPLATDRAWGIAVAPATQFAAVAAGQPFVMSWDHAVLLDIRVIVERGGRASPQRESAGLPIAGSTPLPDELLR